MSDNVTLYRPIGQIELDLIGASGFSAFPPRLPEQPIFYPVLNKEYAAKIARDWNANCNQEKVGYVTKFEVRKAFIEKFDIKVVDGAVHREYWIPASEMEEFNRNIVGKIEVISKFESQ